ncbi:MAG: hypothetical protein DRR00_32300 [Candidatus Parabeggiatoa sp. nov. 3]|nr:MAG: hypothetical protein DRR00_32300 [Gammaproteobacteria bacterium]
MARFSKPPSVISYQYLDIQYVQGQLMYLTNYRYQCHFGRRDQTRQSCHNRPHTVIRNATIADEVEILSHCVIENVVIGALLEHRAFCTFAP